jgi:hypothetical protein
MKFPQLTILLFILTFCVFANAQNSVKLFDAVEVANSDTTHLWLYTDAVAFRTAEVYLSCPRNADATLTGPDGGSLVVDNFMTMNGDNVCPTGRCFKSVFTTPLAGMTVENAYNAIDPIDVGDLLTGSGIYKFELMDHGYILGSTEIYLHTSCSLEAVSQLCHRNFGSNGGRNLSVAESAVSAHLAHGDTQAPCGDQN